MTRWESVRHSARHIRAEIGPANLSALAVVKLAAKKVGLSIVRVSSDNPLLGGGRAALRLNSMAIVVDASLSEAEQAFAASHELGHFHLHGQSFECMPSQIGEDATYTSLPIGEASVGTYNPRQHQELEASVFGAELIMPSSLLRRLFLEGNHLAKLSKMLDITETALLNQMTSTLLALPEKDVEEESDPAGLSPLLLDNTQKAAAHALAGPLLVEAGPGTGKTRTLTARVLALILDQAVPPESILALTFSNKATDEMRDRLMAAIPDQVAMLTIGTFHAFCLDLLRMYAPRAELRGDARVIDTVDAALMLDQRVMELKLVEYADQFVPGRYLKDILRAISRAKDELKDPDDYQAYADAMQIAATTEEEHEAAARSAEVARVYKYYQAMLDDYSLLDFGDIVFKAVQLLANNEDVRAEVQSRYEHVLVDEYQDVNRASAILLQLIAAEGRGLWVVGDSRQSIYKFRGASPINVGRFEEDFPGGRRMQLGINYRSLPSLVKLFSATAQKVSISGDTVIEWVAKRTNDRVKAPIINWAVADDDGAEVAGIAKMIFSLRAGGIPYGEQAVLCCTNGQASAIASALERQGIPVAYVGKLLNRREVKDLLAMLSLVSEPDGTGLVRAAQINDHHIAREDVEHLLAGARSAGYSFPTALIHAHEYAGISQDAVTIAEQLGHRLSAICYGRDAYQFMARYLFGDGTYVAQLLEENTVKSQQALLAIGQLFLLARAFAERPLSDESEDPKKAFLTYVRHLIKTEDARVQKPPDISGMDAVKIMTVHASKGLEFRVVFIPNLSHQRFPVQKPWDPVPPPKLMLPDEDGSSDLESNCLFFVALSRARDVLVLSRAEKYGKRAYRPSSVWALIENTLTTLGIEPDHWRRVDADDTLLVESLQNSEEPDKSTEIAKIDLNIREVEVYLRCPKQYYFRYVLGLHEHGGEGGYKQFHDCVRMTATWLVEEYAKGNSSVQWNDVITTLGEVWEKDGPLGHVHESYYRAAAEAMLHKLNEELKAHEVYPVWHKEAVVELEHSRLKVNFDHSHNEAHQIRLIRYKTGRPNDDHRKEPRLALYREAARQQSAGIPVTIELHYLGDGSHETVSDQGRYERDRLLKLDVAAQSIKHRKFPASPDSPDTCLSCSYNLICPYPRPY